MIHGSIGYGCYFSPDGDIYIEEYDIASDEPPTIDRSRLAQIAALVLSSQNMPKLADLLPKRLQMRCRVTSAKVLVGCIKNCFVGNSRAKVFCVINVLAWVGLKYPDRCRTIACSGLG